MTTISGGRVRSTSWFQIAGASAVAVLAALAWFAWMGWDSQYQVDPVTQVASGPYEAWQVIGCAISLLVLLVGALLAGVRPVPASAALTVAFTAAWTATVAPGDETGMSGVGTTLLLCGLTAATMVVSSAFVGLRRLWSGRRPHPGPDQA
jgi:hypothetical protein